MQNKISGWALGLNGKFWGLIYSDGHSSEEGWTDDIDKIEIDSNSKDMPKTKVWFVCADSHYRDEVNKGEWYYIEVVKRLAKETADNILKTEPVSHKENIDYSNIKKGQYVAKIQDNVAIPVCDNFSQGGYVKKAGCSLIGVVAPAEHYFIGNKIDNSTLEKINNLSEKMNTTVTIVINDKITKTGDLND